MAWCKRHQTCRPRPHWRCVTADINGTRSHGERWSLDDGKTVFQVGSIHGEHHHGLISVSGGHQVLAMAIKLQRPDVIVSRVFKGRLDLLQRLVDNNTIF
ncbi:hypothetical protein CAAN1_08S04588 [[Candida] anglica]|uniref:Uncharacterized protein n=1 Tax=[Candida] anglica TaxID=148631 RepID=A0ABP0E5M4_9ASCO